MSGNGTGLTLKGINYDVGTEYTPGRTSRAVWRSDLVRDEMRSIAEELHCNAVCVYGTDLDRLAEAAETAQDHGLQVWLQPRLIEAASEPYLTHLDKAAVLAADLDRRGSGTVLNVGCEMTIFTAGIMPGDDFEARTGLLSNPLGWIRFPLFNRRLNALLAQAAATARRHFAGTLTYSGALWEQVDWTPFDVVGLNYYRLAYNQRRYITGLRRHYRHGKPVAITEFGCGAHEGAAAKGPASHGIIDWTGERPALTDPPPPRDETVQAAYLADLISVYASEGLHGAFVFEFIEPYNPHDPDDPRHDLDRAGYGLVKVGAEDGPTPYSGGSRPTKSAFDAVARSYAAL
ncbi:hypothetical protein CLV63_11058 [Murinocardiopsis flavida]|uniref:Abortive infection protein n=1 Tax=Murinocardiopsis flavida TaxID=645275 RepID=A0A2P8DHR9_9ACTN|nr:abortive infection protein [Murinocardiopsis flavida]PSK96761.1 hypothetical protein CLV63_11058 [Murinocardiopsis flavida]